MSTLIASYVWYFFELLCITVQLFTSRERNSRDHFFGWKSTVYRKSITIAITVRHSRKTAKKNAKGHGRKIYLDVYCRLKLEQGSLWSTAWPRRSEDSFIPTPSSWSVKANIISRISLVLFALSFIHLSHKNIQTCAFDVNMHFFQLKTLSSRISYFFVNYPCKSVKLRLVCK